MDTRDSATLPSGLMRIGLGVAVLAAALLAGACGGGGDANSSATAGPGREATFDEGTVRMQIEMLDTGLLKGHSYATAKEGWKVDVVRVTAATDTGKKWGVIEIKEQGDADYVTFFEVQIQELARGHQVSVTTTAIFFNGGGLTSERTVVDQWPP